MTGYELSREWFDWCFENPSKARPSHTAIYFWMIELCNRLGWKKEFGIPTLHSMEATGISSKNTYYKSFHDLENWGFIKIIEKAKNQNTPNIITIVGVLKIKSADIPADKSALDSAMIQQVVQQEFSGGNIDKPLNNKTINKKQENEKSARAIEILKNIEEFQEYKNLMSSKITWRDLEISFNDKMDLELVQGKIKFIPSQLLPRLKLYANSWLNIERDDVSTTAPKYFDKDLGKMPRAKNTSDLIPTFTIDDFKRSLENAVHSEYVECFYKAYGFKDKNLGFIVDKFILYIKTQGPDNQPKSNKDAASYFSHWCRQEFEKGNLNSHLKHPKKQAGAL